MMLQEDGAIRVIEGDRDERPIGESEYNNVEMQVVHNKFKKFIKEFAYNTPGAGSINIGTLKYREQFQLNVRRGFYHLEVSLNDFSGHEDGEILCHCLKEKPTEAVPICEKALQELYLELVKQPDDDLPENPPAIQLQFTCDADLDGSFGTMKPLMIRELNSDVVEKMVVVQGIVVSMKKARHKARKVTIKCSNCENVKEIFVGAGFCGAHVPSACDGNSGVNERCPPNSFVVADDLCDFVDEQVLKLQELPEHVPIGEMPRSFDLLVHHYNVDLCTPGSRLTAIGIFCATENSAGEKTIGGNQKGASTVKWSYLNALGITVGQGNMPGQVQFTREEEERFRQLARDPDVRHKVYKSIAPSICASSKDVIDDVKKAVACLLFGGSRKHLPDGTRMRGDINVLLLGDPGTAKSQFLKFSEKAAPISVYTSGKGSSAAGLTAAIKQDGDGFTLEGGAMVLADGGIVCIDEFDKMDVKDRVAIHEAMEQQTISIAKAGITTMLNTRCSVLAAANPSFGSFSDNLSNTAEQMDFETTILSRFDMLFLVKDVRDPERDYGLAKHMSSLHMGEATMEREGPLSVLELRNYIRYCRLNCHPRISQDAGEVLKNHYVKIRAEMKEEKSNIPITVRQLEAIIRISESLAKMQLIEEVEIGHVEEALRLFNVSTLDSANKGASNLEYGLAEAERDEIQKAEEQIRRLIPRGGRKNQFQLRSLLVSASGIEERIANKAIQIMKMRRELEERNNNTLQRVN